MHTSCLLKISETDRLSEWPNRVCYSHKLGIMVKALPFISKALAPTLASEADNTHQLIVAEGQFKKQIF